ncbi:MAG: hypothetical protein JWM16_6358 [Verrucomicrobiales bacterium]|nr:hypothetical protein [Verrucomicrobiales bacterium]
MIQRFFNVLFTLCGIWIAIFIWFWFPVSHVLGAQTVMVIAALPLGIVLGLYYIVGKYVDRF